MTNPSTPEPQNPLPERRKRPATGVTFDEMIAIIVAFSTIGAILFWSIGGKNNKFANNFSLSKENSNNLLASDKTTDTGLDLGFGNILADDIDEDPSSNQDLKAENRSLAAQLKQQETTIAGISSKSELERSQKNNQKSSFNSKAKLAPLAGLATLPAFRRDSRNADASADPSSIDTESGIKTPVTEDPAVKPDPAAVKPEAETPVTEDPAVKPDPAAVKPEAETPVTEDPAVKPDPAAVKPEAKPDETAKIPEDVAPDYWAYPFVKQMRDKKLVPELVKNKEFEPDALITRASMATLVSQAFKDQSKTKNTKKFSDVVKGNAIAKDVDQAVSLGFMQGYSDDEFRPLQNIPRYQVLVTLATGLGLNPPQDAEQILGKFGDSSKMPDWAKQQVAAAAEAGLVVNPPDADTNTLVPNKPATRGEVAAMIHQALVKTGKLQPLESEYIVQP